MTTLGVHEHKRLVRCEAAKRCGTDRIRAVVERWTREVEGWERDRERLVHFTDAALLESFLADDVDRDCGVES